MLFRSTMPTAAPASSPSHVAAPAAAESAAPVQLSPADQALVAPLEACLVQLTNAGLKTPEQKKVLEIRGKLQELSRKLAAHELSPGACTELQALCQAVAAHDFTAAQKHHINLVKTDWTSQWRARLHGCRHEARAQSY